MSWSLASSVLFDVKTTPYFYGSGSSRNCTFQMSIFNSTKSWQSIYDLYELRVLSQQIYFRHNPAKGKHDMMANKIHIPWSSEVRGVTAF